MAEGKYLPKFFRAHAKTVFDCHLHVKGREGAQRVLTGHPIVSHTHAHYLCTCESVCVVCVCEVSQVSVVYTKHACT